MRLAKLLTGLAVLTLLADCGGGSGSATPMRGKMMSPTPLNAAAFQATGVPHQFGDTRPHEWDEAQPSMLPIHGIDAARYQGRIDWDKARGAGVHFAWLKATEGGDYIDPGYATNAPGARAAGVPVGAYHFYYFCRTPEEQAKWFIDNTPRHRGDLPPVLDIEWNHGSKTCRRFPDPSTVRNEIAEYTRIVGKYYHTRPLVYTTPDFYAENNLGQMSSVEFWLRSTADHPSRRYPGERWSFWQWTGTGVVPGVDGITDINAFAGPPSNWYAWLDERRQK